MDRAKLAKIHIAKKELALTDDAYRDILRLHFGVESARELDDRQAVVLLNRFKAKGWKPSTRGQNSILSPDTKRAPRPRRSSSYIDLPDTPDAAQQRKVVALWNELGYPMAALHSRVKRQFGVERMEWLRDHASLHILITDLEARLRRQEAKDRLKADRL